MGQPQFVLLTILLAALIFVRHHANIRRLVAGTEPRIGKKTEG
jgi:glycerol-3-phosphate acyltransferase PlsY